MGKEVKELQGQVDVESGRTDYERNKSRDKTTVSRRTKTAKSKKSIIYTEEYYEILEVMNDQEQERTITKQ